MKTQALALLLIFLVGTMSCTDPNLALAKQNKELVTKAFEVVGNGDFDNLGDYISDNYVRHSQATPDFNITSLDQFKDFIREDRKACPDQQYDIKILVADGDFVAFWGVYKATQTGQMGPFPPSNKRAELEFSGIHRIENNKIVETWVTWDNIAFLSQLGYFPPPQESLESPLDSE